MSSLLEKVYQDRKYYTWKRKLPINGQEEKSLKDVGQLLVVKKFYKIKTFL